MPTRRGFLRLSAAAAAGAAVLGGPGIALGQQDRRKALEKPLPLRDLGKTGLRVSCVGLGCFYLGTLQDEDAAVGIVRRALDLGVNWFDTAPSYGARVGVSEERLGKGIRGARDRVLLATKTLRREAASARAELEESLRRLGTDHLDLIQFHALKEGREAETIFGPGGAFEAMDAARKAGKVRHIGFTGHFDPALMARICRERGVETVLMPLNCLDPHDRSFEKGTLPAAVEKGLGVVAMKVFASGKLVSDPVLSPTAAECLRYVLSLPVATAIVGCSSVEELETDLALAKSFEPMAAEEKKALLERTRAFVEKRIEWYKQ